MLDFTEGQILLINKPYTWTSYNIVGKVKSVLRYKPEYRKVKVGHAGTLDPLATGLMIVCTGKKTKEMASFIGLDKEYIATLYIGATTPSFDKETLPDKEFATQHISKELVEVVLKKFQGRIMQRPPVFSAKWVDGERAYMKARAGEDVEIPEAEVFISDITLLSFNLPEVQIRVSCSKGTYIRALARDIGAALNSGAYISALERTRIGNYHLKDALDVEELKNLILL